MMDTDDEPMMESAWDCYREAQRPSSGQVATTWAALQRRIADGDTGPCVPAVTAEPSRRSAALVGFVAAAACVGAFVILPTARVIARATSAATAVESEFDAEDAADSGAATARVTEPASAPPARRPQPGGPIAADPTAPVRAVNPVPDPPQLPAATYLPAAARPPRKAPRANVPEAPGEKPSSDVSAQARALQQAQASLTAEPREALRRIRAHRADYPDSPFTRERDAVGLLAACALGQHDGVRGRLEAFVQRQPNSPLSRRVQRACSKVP